MTYPPGPPGPHDPYGRPVPPGPWPPAGTPGEQPPVGEPVYVPQPYPYPPQQPPYAYGYPPYGPPYGPPQPAAPKRVAGQRVGWALMGTALVALIAALLPWAYVFGVSIKGTDGHGDGNATLFFSLVVIVMGIVVTSGEGRVWTSIVACVFASLIVLVSLIDLSDITNVANNDGLGGVSVDIGPGLWLTLLAGLAALATSIVGIARRAPRVPRT